MMFYLLSLLCFLPMMPLFISSIQTEHVLCLYIGLIHPENHRHYISNHTTFRNRDHQVCQPLRNLCDLQLVLIHYDRRFIRGKLFVWTFKVSWLTRFTGTAGCFARSRPMTVTTRRMPVQRAALCIRNFPSQYRTHFRGLSSHKAGRFNATVFISMLSGGELAFPLIARQPLTRHC